MCPGRLRSVNTPEREWCKLPSGTKLRGHSQRAQGYQNNEEQSKHSSTRRQGHSQEARGSPPHWERWSRATSNRHGTLSNTAKSKDSRKRWQGDGQKDVKLPQFPKGWEEVFSSKEGGGGDGNIFKSFSSNLNLFLSNTLWLINCCQIVHIFKSKHFPGNMLYMSTVQRRITL